MEHFDQNQILHSNQHGFRKKRSCESQLIITLNDIASSFDNGKQIDSILLDFSKAFDKVDHEKLILKLEYYGINGKIIMWIRNFLYNRTQKVVVNGNESSSKCVLSRVPQGSVLGPLLFLVYINDLPEKISSTIRIFADDSYIYKVIENPNDIIDLQNDLNKLMEWERKWSMSFHPSKCKLLRITNKRKPIIGEYVIHGKVLESVEAAKYLGVTLQSKLSWKPHVNEITKKANQTRAFLQRNLRGCSKEVKSQCYKTYVRPILEYASAVWDPVGIGNKELRKSIESVQRKAARFVFSDWRFTSSPSNMIAELKWNSLEERRAKSRLLIFHKYVNFRIDLPPNLIKKKNSMLTRKASIKYHVIKARLNVYKNSFLPFTVTLWNSLPANIVEETDSIKFKDKLTNYQLDLIDYQNK